MATRVHGKEELENLERWLGANQDSRSERMVDELIEVIGANTRRAGSWPRTRAWARSTSRFRRSGSGRATR